VTVTTVDPANGRALTTYDETTPAELDALLDRAMARPTVGDERHLTNGPRDCADSRRS
jgi:hypothetical protein